MTKSAAEYLPSASEEVPSTSGQGSGSNGKGDHANGAGEGKSVWRRTIAAYLAVTEDGRLDDLAVRVFTWLLERTFDWKEGGDGDGGIIADIQKIASRIKRPASKRKTVKVPKWSKGKRVGFIKREREDRYEHPHPDAVARSLNQLDAAGYIWRERLRKPGWPTFKIFISSIIPKTLQKELFESPSERAHESPSSREHESPSSREHESPSSRERMSPSQRAPYCTGSQDLQGGRKNTPGQSGGQSIKGEGDQETGFQKWRQKIQSWFPDRLERTEAELRKERDRLANDPNNYKRGPMKSDVAELITFLNSDVAKLEKQRPKPEKNLAALRARIAAATDEPRNYKQGALLPSAAASMANFNRKIDALREARLGPR